jgi:thymidylate kinase
LDTTSPSAALSAGRFGRAFVVSLSGIDGAGKSTQIARLLEFLEQSGNQVRVIRFWDDVVMLREFRELTSLKLFKGDKGVGSPERPINRQDKNIRSTTMTLARCAFYFLDALRTNFVVRHFRNTCDVLILDRYLYDELANLPLTNRLALLYVRILSRFAPRPDVACILDADPQTAVKRKPEYSLDFVALNRMSYLILAHVIRDLVVIPPGSEQAVHAQVVQAIIAMLDKQSSQHSLPSSHRRFQGLHMVRRTDEDLSGNHLPAEPRGIE